MYCLKYRKQKTHALSDLDHSALSATFWWLSTEHLEKALEHITLLKLNQYIFKD